MIRVACWAHARRKFYDARHTDPLPAHQALARIGQLYAIRAIRLRKSLVAFQVGHPPLVGRLGSSWPVDLIPMPEITQLLNAAATGDPRAAAQILPLVYDELRKLAAARMAAEAPGQPSTPPPSFTKPTCGWSGISSSTAAGTSLRPPPRPCAGSSSTTPGRNVRRSEATERRGPTSTRITCRPAASTPTAGSTSDEALTRFAAIDPTAAELAKLRVLRRPLRRRGGRGPRCSPCNRVPNLDLRPGLVDLPSRRWVGKIISEIVETRPAGNPH